MVIRSAGGVNGVARDTHALRLGAAGAEDGHFLVGTLPAEDTHAVLSDSFM